MEEETGRTPPALLNRPFLTLVEYEYLAAYNLLCQTRTIGFGGVNPISLVEIKAYLDIYPTWDRDAFVTIIKILDGDDMAKQQESADVG